MSLTDFRISCTTYIQICKLLIFPGLSLHTIEYIYISLDKAIVLFNTCQHLWNGNAHKITNLYANTIATKRHTYVWYKMMLIKYMLYYPQSPVNGCTQVNLYTQLYIESQMWLLNVNEKCEYRIGQCRFTHRLRTIKWCLLLLSNWPNPYSRVIASELCGLLSFVKTYNLVWPLLGGVLRI